MDRPAPAGIGVMPSLGESEDYTDGKIKAMLLKLFLSGSGITSLFRTVGAIRMLIHRDDDCCRGGPRVG